MTIGFAMFMVLLLFLVSGCGGSHEPNADNTATQAVSDNYGSSKDAYGTQSDYSTEQDSQFLTQAITQQVTQIVTQEVVSTAHTDVKTLKMTRNKAGLYHFLGEYPDIKVSGIANADFVTRKMNDNVVGFMHARFDAFLALTAGAPGNSNDIFSDTMTYAVVSNTSSFLAIRFDATQKSAGEMASHQFVYTLNLDPNSGHEIVLKDLFKQDSDYIKALSDFALAAMKADKAIGAINTGDPAQNKEITAELIAKAQPQEANFQNFNITGKSLIIYFARFSKSSAGAYGGVDLSGSAAAQVEIPFSSLGKVLDPNCPYVELK